MILFSSLYIYIYPLQANTQKGTCIAILSMTASSFRLPHCTAAVRLGMARLSFPTFQQKRQTSKAGNENDPALKKALKLYG